MKLPFGISLKKNGIERSPTKSGPNQHLTLQVVYMGFHVNVPTTAWLPYMKGAGWLSVIARHDVHVAALKIGITTVTKNYLRVTYSTNGDHIFGTFFLLLASHVFSVAKLGDKQTRLLSDNKHALNERKCAKRPVQLSSVAHRSFL